MARPLLCWLAVLFCCAAHAETRTFDAQRELFKAAERALEQQDRTRFEALSRELESYPLYAQLLYRDLRQRLAEYPSGEIQAFLDAYADTPLAERLRKAWLIHLAEAQHWQRFLSDYQSRSDDVDIDVEMECYYRQALLATDREAQALESIEALWMSPSSRPKSCDPVFARWRERGGFTPERIWRRFAMAMREDELGLANYLRTLMSAADRETADLWLQVRQRPQRVLEASRFAIDRPHTVSILLYGVHRWSERDSPAARQALDALMQRYALARSDALDQLERRLALFLAARGHPSAAQRLQDLPDTVVDDAVAAWRVRVYLPKGAWTKVLQQLDCMTPAQRETPQWRYWRARALEARLQGREARAIYRELAQSRGYYGFLAADRLNVAYPIEHRITQIDAATRQGVEQHPLIQQAHELYLLGRIGAARDKWDYVTRDFDLAQLAAAAQLAHAWAWYDLAIVTAARAQIWDDLETRFPLPYLDKVSAYARQLGIDPAWVYAVIRQESLFRSDAKSSAGALGLMQIMPATARKIAGDLQVPWYGSYALLRPDTNIRYGAYYLRYTLSKLQNNPLLATAAYNAGPHRVETWLPELGSLAADVWAETIPYAETRKYVKRVMEYAAVYERRLGRAQTSMHKRMMRISPAA